MSGADLRDAQMGPLVISANRTLSCDMTRATVKNADFARADMRQAILVGADLSRANFTGAFLKGVDVTDAIRDAVKGLDGVF
jgi:uncharacterized protein YjbI with pentapeptide repeats